MGTVIALGVMISGVYLIFFPVLILFERLFFADRMRDRQREYRIFAAKRGIEEYQMIVGINTFRRALGQHELKISATIEQFHDWKWRSLMSDARAAAQKGIHDIEAKWKSIK